MKMKKLLKLLIKYLPDIILIIGSGIFAYNLFRPVEERGLYLPELSWTDYHTIEKTIGVILIVIALDIIIRRYFAKK